MRMGSHSYLGGVIQPLGWNNWGSHFHLEQNDRGVIETYDTGTSMPSRVREHMVCSFSFFNVDGFEAADSVWQYC